MNELMLFQLLVQPFSESSWYPWYPAAPPHAQRLCFLLGQPSHGWSGGNEMSKCPAASKVMFFNHGIVTIVTYMGMDQYLLIPFLGGWTSINPSYFDVHQGYKVLTHCHMNLITLRQVCICCSARSRPSNVSRQKKNNNRPPAAQADDLCNWGRFIRFPFMVILGMVMRPIIGFTT
jgi:hypothetical protein